MILINCEINLIFCAPGETNIFNNRYKFYVPIVTLSTEDNAKLLERLRSGLKRTINWNRY